MRTARCPTTRDKKEIDFAGPWLQGIAYEGKYTEGRWKREAQTLGAAYGRGVLTTRNVIERHEQLLGIRAIPAAFVAYLTDPADPASVLG